MKVKRFLYLGYYLRELDWAKFNRFLNYASKQTKKSKSSILTDVFISVLKYNIAPIDYFLFRFYILSDQERSTYAGTGYMYEYQLIMNPKAVRSVLENKIEFLNHYKDFINHDHLTLQGLQNNPILGKQILSNNSGKVVLKSSSGQCGQGVEVKYCKDLTLKTLEDNLKEMNNDLVEEYIIQHDRLMQLSPSGLNTIRVITQLRKDNNVEILAARLRISVNSTVDNLAAGNLAAPIHIETGEVNGPGVYSDITKEDAISHPVTGVPIKGFQIPFWPETLEMVTKAAQISIGNRSIGWDVAITNNGPELIEGNHNWCKLLWQLPAKKGLKSELERFINS